MIYFNAEAVTPSDTHHVNYTKLWVGDAGNVKVMTGGGQIVTFVGLQNGGSTPEGLEIQIVYSTGTTADYIVGMW